MLQSLATRSCTRRATANVVFGSPPSITYAPRRSYATGMNKELADLLRERAEEERGSVTGDMYKYRSFRAAAATIEKFDFKVQHGDQLKGLPNVLPAVRDQINKLLGQEEVREEPSSESPELLRKKAVIKELSTISGIGSYRSEVLYDAGCDTVAKLHLKKYYETLTPKAKRGLKYINHSGSPVPRKNVETLAEFCKHFMSAGKYEVIVAGDYRREVPTILGSIEILIVDRSMTDPIPTPPHPSTLKRWVPERSERTGAPFKTSYTTIVDRDTSVLLNKIIRPLEEMGVATDATTRGKNLWRGWMRVPKKGQSWEPRKERIDGIRKMEGDFHQVNVTHVPKQSRGSALLALTGDKEYYLDCRRKAIEAGLYLNEWGLWRWEPDSQSPSRTQTSDVPHKKTSLGAMWGSETEADKGRWVQLETIEEEQLLNAIGWKYIPPSERNFKFLVRTWESGDGIITTKLA